MATARMAFGRRGEELAARYLLLRGYEIVARNHHIGHFEVDIIARRGGRLVFVEVKTRAVEPELYAELLPPAKVRHLREALDRYVSDTGHTGDARVDLVLVVPGGPFYGHTVTHVEEAC